MTLHIPMKCDKNIDLCDEADIVTLACVMIEHMSDASATPHEPSPFDSMRLAVLTVSPNKQ